MIYLGIVTHHFVNICNFVSTQYLENYLIYFHQILYMHMHSYCQDLAWDCYMSFFGICTRVIALYLPKNFVSTPYLENKLVEFH